MIYSEAFDNERDYSLKHTFEYYASINETLRNEYKYIEVCREIDDSGIVYESQVDTIEEYTGIPIKKYLLERSEVYFGQPVHSLAFSMCLVLGFQPEFQQWV